MRTNFDTYLFIMVNLVFLIRTEKCVLLTRIFNMKTNFWMTEILSHSFDLIVHICKQINRVSAMGFKINFNNISVI
jgi:hypothetical protein